MTAMGDKEARAIIDPAIWPMRAALGLSEWTIDVCYTSLPAGVMAECHAKVNYKRAGLMVDPAQHTCKAELLDSLRHELLHLFHAYFEGPRHIAVQLLSDSKLNAFDVGFGLGAEHTVKQLESLLDDLGMTPRKLIKRGRKMMGTSKEKS